MCVGRVFLSSVLGAESLGDLSRNLRQTAEARREEQPLLCWLFIDPETPIPGPEDRLALQKTALSLLSHCESLTLIVEGDGIQQSLLRATLRGIVTQVGQTQRMRVVEGLEAAARSAADPSIELSTVLRAVAAVRSLPPSVAS